MSTIHHVPNTLIAGVDEVGRGPLIGPVVAAAVILPDDYELPGLTDSKKLNEAKRAKLYEAIYNQALAVSVSFVDAKIIDEINILQASLLAMKQAVEGLSQRPDMAYVDGNKLPELSMPAKAIIQGDLKEPCISAASIIAKVERDDWMKQLDYLHPQYGFAAHKGYPTKTHLQALSEHGALPEHRRSFGPVRRLLAEEALA